MKGAKISVQIDPEKYAKSNNENTRPSTSLCYKRIRPVKNKIKGFRFIS